MAAGNVISPKQIVDSVVVTECLAKTASEEDENEEPSETEARGRPPTNEDPQYLASMALIVLCVKLHFEHPSEFVPEVRNGLTFLLKNLILCLPEERGSAASLVEPHGGPPHPWDQRQRNLSTAALSAIHAVLWLRSDRSFLQSSLLHSFNSQSFVFLKILTVIKSAKPNSTRGLGQGAVVGEQQDSTSSRVQVRETVVLALNVLTSIFKHSSLTKDVFAQLVGFSRLLSCLQVRDSASCKRICTSVGLSVTRVSKTSFLIACLSAQSPALLHDTLKCFFPLPLQSSIARPGREIFSCLFSAAFESKSWVEDEAKISFSSPSNPTLSNPGFLKLILDLIRHADSSLTQEVNSLTFSLFLVADTQLFKRLCPSVGPAVHEHESKSA